MKARLLDPQTTLYSMPDPASTHMAQLDAGQEVKVTSSSVYDKQQWAKPPAGWSAGLPAGEHQDPAPARDPAAITVEAHVEPSAVSAVLERYEGGTLVVVLGATPRATRAG